MSTNSTAQSTRKMDAVDQYAAKTGKRPVRYAIYAMRDDCTANAAVVESFDAYSAAYLLHLHTVANGERPYDRYISVEFPEHLTDDEVGSMHLSAEWLTLAWTAFIGGPDDFMTFTYDGWTTTVEMLERGESVELDSSCLRSVRYVGTKQVLTVEFQSGTTYDYHGVPREVFDELISAESAGRYFVRNIRNNYDAYNITGNAFRAVA